MCLTCELLTADLISGCQLVIYKIWQTLGPIRWSALLWRVYGASCSAVPPLVAVLLVLLVVSIVKPFCLGLSQSRAPVGGICS